MTLSFVQTDTAQGNSLVDGAVIAHNGGLSNDNAAAVVDQNAVSELRARMDLDQGEKARDLSDQACDKEHVMFIKPVCKPVPDQGMNTLVQQKYLQCASCSRIALLHSLYIRPDIF